MSRGGFNAVLAINVFDPDTRAYLARLPVKPSWQFCNAIDRFIKRGKSVGWWYDHTAIYCFAGPTVACGVINLKSASWSSGSIGGTYEFAAYTGTRTNGLDGYIDPNLPWASIDSATLNQHGLWAMIGSAGSSTGMQMGASGGDNEIAFRAMNGVNANFFDGAVSSDLMPTISSIGFTGLFRNNSATYQARQRGAETAFTRAAPTAWPTQRPGIGRLGTGSTFVASQFIMAGFLGGSATLGSQTLRDDLEAAVVDFAIYLGIITNEDLNPEAPSVILPGKFSATGSYSIAAVTPSNLRVMQQFPPPMAADDNTTYAYFYGTDFATTQIGKLATNDNTAVSGHAWLWAMRPNTDPNRQPNPLFAAGFRVTLGDGSDKAPAMEFSTLAIAQAATLAYAAYLTGHAAHEAGGTGYADYWNAAGRPDSTIYTNAYASANASTIFTRTPTKGSGTDQICSLDTLTLPPARASDAPLANMQRGILFDYEPAIDMTAAETIAYTDAVCDIIQAAGFEALFYPNDWNGGNGAKEQLNDPAVAQHIYAKWDWMGVVAWPRNNVNDVRQAVINQLALLAPSSTFAKVQLIVGMGQTAGNRITEAQATILRGFLDGTDAYMAGRKIRFLNIWRYYGVAGGIDTTYNRVLTILGGLTPYW